MLSVSMNMTNISEAPVFNSIVLFETQKKNRKDNLIVIKPEDYKETLEKFQIPNEYISFNQVKPYFDVEIYKEKNFKYQETTEVLKILQNIQTILNLETSRNIYIVRRPPRVEQHNKVLCDKYSYHLIVDGIRINYNTLFNLIQSKGFKDNGPFDLSVYKENSGLFPIYSCAKVDKKTNKMICVPKLVPFNIFNGELTEINDITKYCPSYIQEDFIDYDIKYNKEPKEEKVKFNAELYDNTEITYDGTFNFQEIMTKLSKDRATDYNDWFYIIVALINLFYRKIITRGQIYDLADLFSSKSDNYDADGVSKVIDANISRFNGKGYGIKYLLNCLKIDDIEYYKKITKQNMIINGANDDIGASEIVVNHYKDLFVICKGILYVKNDNIWCYNEKQVDKLLIDMIGSLDIMFYGADGKRLYNYNKSIKHIKDCIVCIKANKTIINDKFYNDMIKNNKYYLPFNDGIYSFKDKKLYDYKDLSNIHFTFKINRNFPKFNQKDYDELMDRVIIPIYPIKEERKYNSHIKSRALAGCYEDKKWYGYSGSRCSGKSLETAILRNSFGDFVLEFNAKCLVLSKFINPDCAKALSWVVDKKDARIIISNEIDGDENTVLNGAFIKTLASGGDSMEGRKNYQDEVSFIPQFTMILCYNHLFEIKPADAKENLEQFEYKSKFVSQDELVDGIPFLKLKDDTIKTFIKEERIIDAYTLYILNAFTDPRINTPESIKNSTEINNGEEQISVEQFIIKNFVNSNDSKDRLHTENISSILNDKGYKIDVGDAGKLINRIGIGKYNKNCNIDKCKKRGYDNIKYINEV